MRCLGFVATMLFCAEPVRASCAWHATDRITIAGDIDQGGLHGTFQRIIAPASGRFTESIDLGILKTGSGFNGQLAWSRDPSSFERSF